MAKNTKIKLSEIREYWSELKTLEIISKMKVSFDVGITKTVKENYKFLLIILPDCYDKEKVPNIVKYKEYLAIDSNFLQDENARRNLLALFSGNIRLGKKGKSYFAAASFTKQLKELLLSDEPIEYLETVEQAKLCTPMENMRQKIKSFVSLTKVEGNHTMFHQFLLDESDLYDKNLVLAMQRLLECNTEDSISYAVLLLILIAIFQDKMGELKKIYSESVLEGILGKTTREVQENDEMFQRRRRFYLTDTNYMHDYYLYLFRPNREEMYEYAHLKMECEQSDKAKAILSLKGNLYSPTKDKFEKVLSGTPVVSLTEQMVYIVFSNELGELKVLLFRYEHYVSNDMYYRTGLLVGSRANSKVPMVQKVMITLQPLEKKQYKIAEGKLKMADDMICITEEELRHFLEEFQEESWMSEFQVTLLPFIKEHRYTCYRFSEKEILSYTLTKMSEREKLQLLQLLKREIKAPRVIDCQEEWTFQQLLRNK